MEEADAVVVLAFTRWLVKKAVEKPDSNQQKETVNTKYPTIWNQLEAAMAFGLKRPLLVILEEGLHQEAMLKDRFEFRTWVTPLDPALFRSDEFKAAFADFLRIASERGPDKADAQNAHVGSMTIGELVRGLRPDQLWKAGTAVAGLLSAVAAAAFWVGKYFGGVP